MKEVSSAFRDAPQTPQQRALFWIEYVLRNKNSSKNYLRPASVDLQLYQKFAIDVISLIILSLAAIYFTMKAIIRIILLLISGKNESIGSGNTTGKKKIKKKIS